jgi:hypothetical protein
MSEVNINLHNENITLDDLKVYSKPSVSHDTTKGWYEVKMTGKLPERRSYQISEVHNEFLYIFGG